MQLTTFDSDVVLVVFLISSVGLGSVDKWPKSLVVADIGDFCRPG